MTAERGSIRTEPITDADESSARVCRACGLAQVEPARFCEACGADLDAVFHAGSWSIEIGVDPSASEAARESGLAFPDGRLPTVIALDGAEVVVGRRRTAQDECLPDIDLSDSLADPAVSHVHALITRGGGSFTITDLGSTNGTTIEPGRIEIVPNEPHPLRAGDRIMIGAWTVIRVIADGGGR